MRGMMPILHLACRVILVMVLASCGISNDQHDQIRGSISIISDPQLYVQVENSLHCTLGPFAAEITLSSGQWDNDSVSLPEGSTTEVVRVCDSTDKQQECTNVVIGDDISKLVSVWRERYRSCVDFNLELSSQDELFEVFWVHAKGNARLVWVGLLNSRSQGSLRQYTRAGHFFVITRHSQSWFKSFPEVSVAEFPWELVVALYLSPAIGNTGSGCQNILIDPSNSVIQVKSVGTSLLHSALHDDTSASAGFITTTLARSMVLQYWEHQRRAQVLFHSWVLPSLVPLSKAWDLIPLGTTWRSQDLFTRFHLPAHLAADLQTAYLEAHRTHCSAPGAHNSPVRAEPIISMVFNQLEHLTYFVDLEQSSQSAGLKQRLEEAILIATRDWTESHADDWEITGTYLTREYRTGAILRWHVDPVESQPITAIVHIGEGQRETRCELQQQADGAVAQEWEQTCDLQVGTGSQWTLQIPRTITGHKTDLEDDSNMEHIALAPGEVLLLHSAKVPHARLFPLEDRSVYANAFVHLRPKGWEEFSTVRNLAD